MGTLSHHYGKPFGYKGLPGTCRWCGEKLRYQRVTADDPNKADPTYKEEPGNWATVRAAKPGGYQDGLFCGLRCGYQWAVRALSRN
jgi:hypothetical protein